MNKFKIGKMIFKGLKAAIPAGAVTAIATTSVVDGVVADTDIPTTAIVTVSTWIVGMLLNWLKNKNK